MFALKGIGGNGRLAWPRRPGKTKLSKAAVYGVGVDTIKDILYGRLAKVADPGPGYIHLPSSVDEEWCDQFTSETKIYKMHMGRRVAIWRPKKQGIRQEAQDCWNYAYAVMRGRNTDLSRLADAIERRRGEMPAQASAAVAHTDDTGRGKSKVKAASKRKRRNPRVVRSNYLARK